MIRIFINNWWLIINKQQISIIRMISEGSCDTTVMTAEKSDLPFQEYITFKNIFQIAIIFHIITVFTIFLIK